MANYPLQTSRNQLSQIGTFNKSAPSAATNLVSVATGTNFNLCLRNDGRVFGWGSGAATNIPSSVTNIFSIAVGLSHGLAVRGDGGPHIVGSVAYHAQCSVGNLLPLSVRAVGQSPLKYQWLSNSLSIWGITNAIPPIPAVLGNDNVSVLSHRKYAQNH